MVSLKALNTVVDESLRGDYKASRKKDSGVNAQELFKKHVESHRSVVGSQKGITDSRSGRGHEFYHDKPSESRKHLISLGYKKVSGISSSGIGMYKHPSGLEAEVDSGAAKHPTHGTHSRTKIYKPRHSEDE